MTIKRTLIQICLLALMLGIGRASAQTLINGANVTGAIPVGAIDVWTFTANNGDVINLRLGTTNFSGALELFEPTGTRVDFSSILGDDNNFEYTATNSGTFTVHISSVIDGGSGTYVLRLAQTPEAFVVPSGDEGGGLTNGANVTGAIPVGDIDMWTFIANKGDVINLRLGTTNFSGALELFGPTGTRADFSSVLGDDNNFEYTATNSGTFTVLVSSETDGGTGTYILRLAQTPEVFVVPSGDEGGGLTNGANVTGAIPVGDIDMWTFIANKGDVINLRLGTTNFSGALELFGPTGTRADFSSVLGDDNNFEYTATNSGTFTVHISSVIDGGSGTYVLRLAQTPEAFVVPSGDEGGGLTNGANVTGAIPVGDIDMWTFIANKGDVINLRLGTTNFSGALELFGPTGTRVDFSSILGDDNNFEYTAATNGTFTVLVSSETDGGTGTYILRLAQTPEAFVVPSGDEGGVLINGANVTGAIPLGDIDMWTFTAFRGDVINLNLNTTNLQGYLELFGPTGALVEADDSSVVYKATSSGTFTVLVSSDNSGGSGTYGLHLAQTHAAFVVLSGVLTNGANETGAIALNTTNLYTFTANAGDSIFLRLGTTNINGELQLYGPDGSLLATTAGFALADVNITGALPSSGTYTVLVNSESSGGTGTYGLRLAQAPEPFVVPAGDEGGALTGAQHYHGIITLADIDMWSFTALKGDFVSLELKTTNFDGRLDLYGPNGALLASAALTNTDVIVSGTLPSNGAFIAIVTSEFSGGTGTYGLIANELSGGLKISTPAISGANLTFIGVGGTANAAAVLYSSTNIAMPFGLWTPTLTNYCDQFGVFNATNMYNPASQKQRYFRLVVP